MSIYKYNITGAKGDEDLIIGKGGQVTKITLITVNKDSGAFSFSLLLTTGSVTTTLYTQSVDEGDAIIDTNGYEIDQSTTLSMTATADVNVVIMGETTIASSGPTNSPPPNTIS